MVGLRTFKVFVILGSICQTRKQFSVLRMEITPLSTFYSFLFLVYDRMLWWINKLCFLFIFTVPVLVLLLTKQQKANVLWTYLYKFIIHICLQVNLYLNFKRKKNDTVNKTCFKKIEITIMVLNRISKKFRMKRYPRVKNNHKGTTNKHKAYNLL